LLPLKEMPPLCSGTPRYANRILAEWRSLDAASLLQGETYLNDHLVMGGLPILDLSPCRDDLEPSQVFESLGCPADRVLDGILDAGGRGADKFYNLVDVLAHDLTRWQDAGHIAIDPDQREAGLVLVSSGVRTMAPDGFSLRLFGARKSPRTGGDLTGRHPGSTKKAGAACISRLTRRQGAC
jgi:hypothetical protein